LDILRGPARLAWDSGQKAGLVQGQGGPSGISIPTPTAGLAQLDTDLQQLTKVIGQANAAIVAALKSLGIAANLSSLQLVLITPPAPPASGSIIYVSNVDTHTYIVNSSGVRTLIAP